MEKYIKSPLIAFFLLSCWMGNAQVRFIKENLGEALQQAKSEKKYIMVDVYTSWCGWCKKMDASTFRDSQVSDFVNANMVALKLDAEHGDGPSFAQKHRVSGFPTIVYLDWNGNLVKVEPGYKSASALMSDIERYKVKKASGTLGQYMDLKKEDLQNLENEILKDTELLRVNKYASSKNYFDFDQYKMDYQNNPQKIAYLDLYYQLFSENYDQALDILIKHNLTNEFDFKKAEFVVLKLIGDSKKEVSILKLANDFTVKPKTSKEWELKMLAQINNGDVEDAKKSLKSLKKSLKKEKKSMSESQTLLRDLVMQS